MIIFFTALCVFFSCIACVKIVLIEQYLEKASVDINQNNESFCKSLNSIKLDIRNSGEDIYNRIDDLKLEIKFSNECFIEEKFKEMQEILETNFSHLDSEKEKIILKIEETKSELILLFEKEKLELEKMRSSQTKKTFNSIRTALSPNGIIEKDDK